MDLCRGEGFARSEKLARRREFQASLRAPRKYYYRARRDSRCLNSDNRNPRDNALLAPHSSNSSLNSLGDGNLNFRFARARARHRRVTGRRVMHVQFPRGARIICDSEKPLRKKLQQRVLGWGPRRLLRALHCTSARALMYLQFRPTAGPLCARECVFCGSGPALYYSPRGKYQSRDCGARANLFWFIYSPGR